MQRLFYMLRTSLNKPHKYFRQFFQEAPLLQHRHPDRSAGTSAPGIEYSDAGSSNGGQAYERPPQTPSFLLLLWQRPQVNCCAFIQGYLTPGAH